MSRIGRMPIPIPKPVSVTVTGNLITVKGPKGELKHSLDALVKAEVKDGLVLLSADLAAARNASAVYGTTRARVHNLVRGVETGFSKVLDIVGLGFRAEATGQKLNLTIGKSHPVFYEAPEGISVIVDAKKTQITVSGPDKDLVGEVAANIRSLRPPEPYKGTGIKYSGEHIRRKAGKTAAGAGASAAVGGKK